VWPPPADDINIRAHFQPITLSLTLNTDGNGATVPTVHQDVTYGVPIQITAIPAGRYYFKNWSVVSGTAAFDNYLLSTTNVTLTSDAVIMAHFDTKLITVGNIADDSPGIGIELRDDGKIYCYVIDARDTGDTDQLDYNATVSANNSTIAVFNTTNINFYDGGYHNILFEWSIANNESRYGILHVDNNYYTPESSTATRIGKQTPCSFNFASTSLTSGTEYSGTFVALGANLYGEGSSAYTAYNSNNKTFTGQYHKFIVWDTVLTNQAYLDTPDEFDPFVKQIINQAEIDPLLDSNLQSWKYNVVTYHKFDSLDVSVSAPVFSLTGFIPPDGSTGIPTGPSATSLDVALSWICTDPLGLDIDYDVFFGLESSGTAAASQIATSITASTITVSGLSLYTSYTWFVVASNFKYSTTSIINQFLTKPYGGTSFSAYSLGLSSSINNELLSKSDYNFVPDLGLTSSYIIMSATGQHNWIAFGENFLRMSDTATDRTVDVSMSSSIFNKTDLDFTNPSTTSYITYSATASAT
jgi:hypothetical protein